MPLFARGRLVSMDSVMSLRGQDFLCGFQDMVLGYHILPPGPAKDVDGHHFRANCPAVGVVRYVAPL